MGKLYSQLTEGERNQIYELMQEDVSHRRIEEIMDPDKPGACIYLLYK